MSGIVNFHGGKIYKKTQKVIFGAKSRLYSENKFNMLRSSFSNTAERTRITATSAIVEGTTTSIPITPTGAPIIRKGDRLLIVDSITNAYQEVTVTQTVSKADSSITITSIDLGPYNSGSSIYFSAQTMSQRIAGGVLLSEVDIDNAGYVALGTTPQTIVSSNSNGYIFPVQIWIQVLGWTSSAGNESANETLYVWYSSSGGTSNYLGRIPSFNRGARANSTWIFPLLGYNEGGRIQINNTFSGEGLVLQSSGNFASSQFTLKVFVQYQMIGE